jgi:hypothetical protein
MTVVVFWVVTPCGPVGRYQRFGETYCRHLQERMRCKSRGCELYGNAITGVWTTLSMIHTYKVMLLLYIGIRRPSFDLTDGMLHFHYCALTWTFGRTLVMHKLITLNFLDSSFALWAILMAATNLRILRYILKKIETANQFLNVSIGPHVTGTRVLTNFDHT